MTKFTQQKQKQHTLTSTDYPYSNEINAGNQQTDRQLHLNHKKCHTPLLTFVQYDSEHTGIVWRHKIKMTS